MKTSNNNLQILGLVQDQVFKQLHPISKLNVQLRFTGNQPQESVPPESRELNLAEYEGRAIMIRGVDQGGWIYSAEVIDTAGPIFTAVVEKLFKPSE